MKLEHCIELKVHNRFIGYRRVGFLFDMYAWFLLFREFNINIGNIQKEGADALMQKMLYTSALSYCKEKGMKARFTQKDVEGWIDGITNRDAKELGRVFADSMKVIADKEDLMLFDSAKSAGEYIDSKEWEMAEYDKLSNF